MSMSWCLYTPSFYLDAAVLGDVEDDSVVDLPLLDNAVLDDEGEGDGSSKPPPAKKTPPPYILGEGLPVVPGKIVAKIQKGDFVDMADLLRDNMEAERRRLSMAGGVVASILAGKSPRREVPDLLSWVTSFSTYASILSEKYPQLTKGLWAYQTFIVREARRCGGHGWQEYDLMFRQQATATNLKWDTVNSSLYTVTFGAQSARAAPVPMDRSQARSVGVCRWCQEPDHASADCAIAQLQQSKGGGADAYKRQQRSTPRPAVQRPCFSWNSGRCRFEPDCRFQHVCSVKGCLGPHKASECRLGRQADRRPANQ